MVHKNDSIDTDLSHLSLLFCPLDFYIYICVSILYGKLDLTTLVIVN